MTRHLHDIKRLAKLITYVLGRRPDEFGLIPDSQGFIKIKSLLKAIHEEPQWGYLRLSHLNELTISLQPSPVEMSDNRIRANDRSGFPELTPPLQLPKLLFTAIRRRAYPYVAENGIPYGSDGHIVLSSEEPMARRLGRRMDNDPVILTVNTDASQAAGVAYLQFGAALFICDRVPTGTFSGPPLPKEHLASAASEKAKEPGKPKTPGSFFPDPDTIREGGQGVPLRRDKRERTWQKDRRVARKEKQRNSAWSK
jgi:putative RNA 2'-phosphotransferase